MALSPYRERDSPVFRNRSSSLYSQSSRNILYQEVFEVSGNALVRSYSCGQVFAKDENGQTFRTTQVRISNFISPVKRLAKFEQDRKSSSVPKKLAITYQENKPSKAKMSLQFTKSEETSESVSGDDKLTSNRLTSLIWRNTKRTIYVNLVILTILSACHIYRYNYCNQQWDTHKLVNKLKESVFGQERAISSVENVLTRFRQSHDSAVMCFTGSVGVGKTFVSSIIYNDFPWVSNEYIDFYDSNTGEMLQRKEYSFCGVNLIVIDGIDIKFSESAFGSVQSLIDNSDGAKFLVILIFGTKQKDEVEFVFNNMRDGRFYHVPFRDLKQQEVKECFNAELRKQKKFISQEKLNELLTDHMKFCNISKSFQGCKNVFHEVSRIPESE